MGTMDPAVPEDATFCSSTSNQRCSHHFSGNIESVSYSSMAFFLEWNCLLCECSSGKDDEPVHDELSQKLRTDACVWMLV